ncbi:MAG TPA: MarR family winged helix-turn-helix transcriptional regulator [Candidatus Saccharimonadia bacterium]|nr:MarR family winged helix-turn-helix transcriptional regulator [Candidatus Saccharimonadia bacterium]
MSQKLPPARVAAWRGLLTTHAKVVSRIEQRLAEAKLPPLAWYDVLFALYEAPEKRLRMAELADQVLLSRSGLTRLVDRLEAAKCLKREDCPTDKRGYFVHLSTTGIDTLRKMWPVYRDGISRWFSAPLSEKDIDSLSKAFGKIGEGMVVGE